MFVPRLGGQLEERQQGNAAYGRGDFQAALQHYTAALAVLQLLSPTSPQDMALVEHSKVG